MRGFLALFVTLGIALVAGLIGYQLGVASNVAAAGGVVWLGWGFPGFGFLFFLLFIGFLLFVFSGRRRAWGPGPWGHGHGYADDGRRQWVADAHRRLHEEEARTAAAPGTPGTAATTGSTGTTGGNPDWPAAG